MSDGWASSDVDPQDVRAMLTILLGGPHIESQRDPGAQNVTPWSAGLLRRMWQANQGDPIGVSQVLGPSVGVLRLAVPNGATSANVSVEGGDVRMLSTGQAPTAGVGVRFTSGAIIVLQGVPTMQAAQFVAVAAAVTLNAEFFS